ncbi:MAG: D-tyrosyl-tRNA(Tyr) deacylase [Deltaproteobacteria bacterium]|nr:D-tyrosyl-tRNA(Tyr) deacylase [Deltaproteobacteria bacterium]
MRMVLQRVSQAQVYVAGEVIGTIGRGLVVLLGVAPEDTLKEADLLAKKVVELRIFEDGEGKMNLSVKDVAGQVLVVSQFTLLADCRKGRRPSFTSAADPAKAEKLYEYFITRIQAAGVPTAQGKFGAMMEVALVNHGPVTLVIDSNQLTSRNQSGT